MCEFRVLFLRPEIQFPDIGHLRYIAVRRNIIWLHTLAHSMISHFSELLFVQELNRTVNSLSEYYMGFYIHTCQKMRYKGRLYPSFLLCSEAYTWHLLNDGEHAIILRYNATLRKILLHFRADECTGCSAVLSIQ